MRSHTKFVAVAVALAMLLTASYLVINGVPANAQDPPAGEDDGVTVTVDGNDSRTNVAEGNVVDQGNKTDGVDCAIPDVTIEMDGAFESVTLAVNNDNCNTYIEEIVRAAPFPDEPSERFSTASHKWRVGALAEVKGLLDLDTLTRTTGEVDFKMSNFAGGGAVYGGSNRQEDCWGNHKSFPWYYYVDTCTRSGSSLSGPSSIYNEAKGVFTHSEVSSWGHTTWGKAEARGYREMPHVFKATCRGDSLPPWPAKLRCELEHEYLGYE